MINRNISEYQKNYYQNNKERIIKRAKEYYKNHISKIKKYRERIKNKTKVYMKNYRSCNRYIIKINKQKWDKNNKRAITIYRRKYKEYRLKFDIKFKILWNLRTRLNKVMHDVNKSAETIKLLGCSIEFLKIRLEKQFKPGMTWDNYGLWHIDHIKPCASFDLSKPSEQRKCFNYKNLQPLWAIDNLRKSDNYENT